VAPSARSLIFLLRGALVLGGVLAPGAACGKKSETVKKKEDAAVAPTVSPIATPPVGVDAVKRMNFTWEAGLASYEKAMAAYKAKTRDWSAIRTHAEAAIGKDASHLDARYLLAIALARVGEPAAAVEHFVAALAGDYYKYAPLLDKDDDLKEFFATPHGASIKEVGAKIKAEYDKRIASGLWLVARRSAFKWPAKPGVEFATSRGELYAFDRETRRYLRLSHTEHQAAGFVRSAAGTEVLLLGFDKIDRPKPAGKEDDPTPLIASAWLEVLDAAAWTPIVKRVALGAGREVSVGYGPGDQILVSTAPASGRWGVGAPATSSLDRTTGKLTKVTVAPPVPRIAFTLDEGRVIRAPEGVRATWAGDPPTAPALTAGGAAINVPESGAASQATVALSPDQAFLAFATAADPCGKDVAPSLYVANAKTGALKHLLSARSRFSTRWIDATTLAYEDGAGAIRLWDPTRDGRGGQLLLLENKPGIALDVLSFEAAPVCKQGQGGAEAGSAAGSAGAGGGSSDEPPLPPEEPAGN
jgi:hypothetical protein